MMMKTGSMVSIADSREYLSQINELKEKLQAYNKLNE